MNPIKIRAASSADAVSMAGWVNQTGHAVDTDTQAEGERLYLAIDEGDRPVACLRLREHLGLALPRYSYHVGQAVHAASELGLFQRQATLLLGNDQTGDSELTDIACAPGLDEALQQAALQTLLDSALARIAGEPLRHGARLIVELGGVRDAAGRSVFWQGLGAHFCPRDPAEAQVSMGEAWRSHLAALLPRQLLYLSFLDAAAQAAVGQAGVAAQPALKVLRASGFAPGRHVRIDDGGPIWELSLAAS
ncbi:arginine N-succinyltransferase [Paucibacter sp. JuS9]|uniref:arginine N-succinyltransferase n=1 Tax=Roseateles TaxID=93681 RepID=UPI002FE682E0